MTLYTFVPIGFTPRQTNWFSRAQRVKIQGYDYCLVSENISYQYSSVDFGTTELADRYVEGWKASPGHRKNMREPAIVDMAAAVVKSPRTGRYYAVQMFGRPKSEGVEFRVTNSTNDGVRYEVEGEAFSLQPGRGRLHEMCVPPQVSLLSQEGRRTEPMKVHRGDHFKVTHERGRLMLRNER